jgi:hypothetical protein
MNEWMNEWMNSRLMGKRCLHSGHLWKLVWWALFCLPYLLLVFPCPTLGLQQQEGHHQMQPLDLGLELYAGLWYCVINNRKQSKKAWNSVFVPHAPSPVSSWRYRMVEWSTKAWLGWQLGERTHGKLECCATGCDACLKPVVNIWQTAPW